MQQPVAGADLAVADMRQRQIDHAPMLHHRALGGAGGARGVDDVGEVAGAERRAALVRGDRRRREVRRRLVEAQRREILGQPRRQRRAGQHQRRAGIGEQEGEPCRRVAGIERQVAAARLQHRQHRHHQLGRALQRQPHHRLRTHPQPDQPPRQPVRPRLQGAIAHRLAAARHRHRLRRPRHLLGEQLRQRRLRHRRRGRVPILRQPPPLLPRQQRQLREPPLRTLRQEAQRPLQMQEQPLRRRAVVEIAIVFQLARQPVFRLRQRQGQLELRRLRRERQHLRPDPRQRRRRLRLVLQHQHHLEQRAALQRAHRAQLLHQLLEGQVLMRERPQRRLAHLRQQPPHARGPVQPRAQHQRVDEEPDQPLDLVPRPVRHRRPQQDVALTAPAPQHQRQRRLQHHEQRHPLAARQVAQRARERALEMRRDAGAAAAPHAARPVRRQAQRVGRPGQRRPPILQVARRRVMPPLPQRVIGILHRQRRQPRLAAFHRRAVERLQLLQQDRRRPAVEGDVVHHHRQHVMLRPEPQQRGRDRQLPRQAEAPPRQRRQPIRQRSLVHILQAQREPPGRLDRLRRHPVHHREGGAQRLVPRHHARKRHAQRRRIQRTREPQRHRHRVARPALQLLQEPQPLLRERQRQRRRPRARPQRLARRRLRSRHHVGQPRQARMLEHAAQRQLHPQHAAHPRHQPRRQQRMAAEVEEVVVAADAVAAEELGPERRQQLLHRALRRLEALRLAPHRLGQRAPVELAAGRARQRRQPDIALRQHVRRQPRGQVRAQRRGRDLRAAARDIGHQPLAPHHHRRLRHRGVLQQRRLDLAGLDAQAPQLHLPVRAAEELHHPVRPPAPEIPGAVEPAPRRAERVRHEALRRELRTTDISPRQAHAAEIDLPRHPHRHRRQSLVQEVEARVRDRPAQGRRHRALEWRAHRGADRGLGRAIGVDHAPPGRVACHQLGRAGLAAHHQRAARGQRFLRQAAQHARHQQHVGDASSAISRASGSPGTSRSGGAITSVAPDSSAIHSSATETSKAGEAYCSSRSPGRTSQSRICASARLTTPRCCTSRPWGRRWIPRCR